MKKSEYDECARHSAFPHDNCNMYMYWTVKKKQKTEVALLGWIDVKAVTEFGHFKLKSDCTN